MSRLATSSTVIPLDAVSAAQIEDALVGDELSRPGVEHRVGVAQAGRDVVGGQHRRRGGAPQAVGAHQPDVGPGDRQHARRPPGAAETAPGERLRPGSGDDGRRGQERRQVRLDADRPDARTAAAVRDAERLVQVEVRDVGAEVARPADPDQRVEVGAVQIDLAAGLVHQLQTSRTVGS